MDLWLVWILSFIGQFVGSWYKQYPVSVWFLIPDMLNHQPNSCVNFIVSYNEFKCSIIG